MRRVADRCLDAMMFGKESSRWHDAILTRKFEAYNEVWLDRTSTLHTGLNGIGKGLRRSSSGLKRTIELDDASDDA